MAKLKAKINEKPVKKESEEEAITDIVGEYFFEGEKEMVKLKYFSGDKLVKEEIKENV